MIRDPNGRAWNSLDMSGTQNTVIKQEWSIYDCSDNVSTNRLRQSNLFIDKYDNRLSMMTSVGLILQMNYLDFAK